MSVAFFCFFSPKQRPTLDVRGPFLRPGRDCDSSICERCFRGPRSLQTAFLHEVCGDGGGLLAKSTICWISLSSSLSSFLPSTLPRSCLSDFFPLYYKCRSKKKRERGGTIKHTHIHTHTETHRPSVYTTRASCWLEHRAPLRTARHSLLFFFS